ncbi:hydantoinase/oxoprolinase family protein [Methylobacterium oryzihabitans]|uniref:Hydantoinase/oxoprolinase family protein n=1 Tax=Methylobacterium oryzihabitans TaxID=2499852 RepID=A0A437NUR2_9HYPH|nr:hydantoinase/oxoprolinase family protein [Methylobacterium oryzihabitans]RVU13789.1 hydantoinase/oxoprolinase family protein [Methylobacterium oryzihabitans]
MTQFRIGIDVGGTFTDLVAIDRDGATVFAKSPSTPADPSLGVLAGLEELAGRLGLGLRALLAGTERIVHGTTVATNALLERKGARVALLTTEGHRDVLEMREGLKDDRYDLRSPPPAPLVPRALRIGVRERLRADGSVAIPLDDASLDAAVARVRESGATSVAVCYLHAYRNPAHEIATVERLARDLPEVSVSRSSDVLPQIKEYERVSTTVVNAYVGPAVQRYLARLEHRLREGGLSGSLFIILSHGGMAPVEEAGRLAAATVLSGPAGGVAGARLCAAMLGIPDLIPFDVGGTSTDISLIVDGQAALSGARGLAGERIALRSLDIASVAAGGGSLASFADGRFQVGPESAGAVPGPACYGGGGTRPAVTDANLLLGYLDPATFLGGRKRLDQAAAEAAVDALAPRLGLSRDETALGIHRLINLRMADGIRLMTLRRGVDPRRFALLSFGGAAGLHAVAVARELEIPRVVVPTVASVLSAWGMLASDLRYEVSRTHVGESAAVDDEGLRAIFSDLEARAGARLREWTDAPPRIERSAEMRYGEQVFEIDVPLDDLAWDAPDLVARVHERFHARHEELFTYASRDQEVVFVNARVAAVGAVPAASLRPAEIPAAAPSPGERRIFLDGWRTVPVHRVEALVPGTTVAGPALFEAETTTVLAGEGDVVTVNRYGWLDIALRPGEGARGET